MNRRFLKPLAVFMALNMLTELCFPTAALALTGGPSQPEMESFEPVGTTDMVDLFTGDFNYNIPLIDVGGYPINIAYHSGVTMDQEASWVGLGWNINAGVISRVTRGLPDDFNSDEIKTETNIRENINWSLFANPGVEFMGIVPKDNRSNPDDSTKSVFGVGLNLGVTHNNYRGRGYFFGMGFNIPFNNSNGASQGGMRLGFNGSSQGGFEYDVSYTRRTKSGLSVGGGIGMGSRTGMKVIANLNRTANAFKTSKGEKHDFKNTGDDKYTQNLYNNTIPISPAADLPTLNQSFNTYVQNYNLTVGGEIFGLHANMGMSGSYSSTTLSSRNLNRQAFGYLYSENANGNGDAMQDFSREREGSLNQYTKNLPISSSSYDVLSVSGQGTGGMFRPHRNNTGVYYDNRSENKSSNWATLGVEVGFGNLFHLGLNYTPTVSKESSGPWQDQGNNMLSYSFGYTPKTSPYLDLYEKYYYQSGGEKVITDSNFNKSVGGDLPVRLNIDRSGVNYYADVFSTLETDYGTVGGLPLTHDTASRQIRSQHIGMLTVKESRSGVGYMPGLTTYPANYFEMTNPTYRTLDRVSNTPARDHHIGELIQTNPDGTRYVYAIPAYNNYQREASFTVAGNAATPSKGLVTYEGGKDNSSNNWKGQDHFYNKVETPASAHSYLLTAVLSADYADTDQDGKPSEGDVGQYVKFNYTRHDSDYKWRTPFDKNMAQLQEGLKSDPQDNKGNYIYGSKEIWYLQSIESRTHIAEFKMSPRFDGFGVVDENGGADLLRPLMKLDTIVLYSRPDRLQNKGAAVPIKKVVLEYNYSLCKQIPNNRYAPLTVPPQDSTGKLTLKKLYFLYGNSGKGSMSPYKFTYDSTMNYNYSLADYDRWGNYKPNDETTVSNRDYPYTDQTMDSTTADKRAGAWSLTRIDLPSGGFIQTTYESDDYAFVQDRKAMQMIKIVGATDDASLSSFKLGKDNSNLLYTNQGSNRRNYLIFKLPATFSSDADLQNRCFKNIDNLYFKFLINIKGKYEYISGWCQINKNHIGILPGDQSLGYVEVKTVSQGDVGINMNADVNAISKTAWQFAIANMQKALHPGSDPNGTGVGAFEGLLDGMSEALDMYRGQYQSLKVAGVASEFVTSKSWIRIESPTMFKYGGGCRVKQMAFNDSWSQMDVNDKFAQYEQTYDYTVNDPDYGLISSGVASYEPMIGGEENPFRLPIKYMQSTNPALPALELYNEEPYGESLLPPAVVGYSKISVRNKPKTGVVRTGSGHTEYEFYTARDFPVEFQNTRIHPESMGAGLAGAILSAALKAVVMSSYSMTQGYVVKLNDMHGKPKATSTFSEMDQSPTAPVMISKVSYQYQTINGKLNNKVQVLDNFGKIKTAEIGKEIDMSVDMRQNERWEVNAGLQANGKFDLAGFFLVAYAIPLPTFKYSLNRMQAVCVTKVIQQYGVLEATTVQDEGSIITTKNLLYDKATGQVLLTQTKNSFEDPIYNFTYPAHMAYDGMEGAYQNTGVTKSITTNSNGIAVVTKGIYTEGDELMLTNTSTGDVSKAWVLTLVANNPFENITLIDINGVPLATAAYTAKIIRSGRRNMTSLPVAQVVSTTNPISGDSIRMSTATIAQATANTFNHVWKTYVIPKQTLFGTPSSVGCEVIPDTFLTQSFFVIMDRIRADRAVHSGNILPYNLAGLSWFNNTALQRKCQSSGAYDSLFTMISDTIFNSMNVTPPASFSVPPPFRSTWYNSDTVFFYLYSKTGASTYKMKGLLKVYSATGCLFKDVDTIYSIVPDTGTGVKCRGKAYAKMLNGDTCMFNYIPPTGVATAMYSENAGYQLVNCVTPPFCVYYLSDVVNPYLIGAKDAWRPQKTMGFVEDLLYTYKGDTTFIRRDGTYNSFIPYWSFSTSGTLQESIDKRWIPASTITLYHPKGNAGEAKDALGNYSAELYGYDERFVTASCSFAQLRDIGNDNFEDYTMDTLCDYESHWSFKHGDVLGTLKNTTITSLALIEPEDIGKVYTNPFITQKQAHTGVQSLCMPPGFSRKVSRFVDSSVVNKTDYLPFIDPDAYAEKYVANTFPRLMPQVGKKYYISAWVKGRAIDINKVNTYDSAWVRVQAGGSSPLNVVFKARGPIIDGWQRIEGSFTIPANADYFHVLLENTARYKAYFDDIRIHPFESNMKTFVYDPVLLKVMATLDENNFASFYEYDKEGKLIRIKKETEKGVMTIQESRGSKSKVIHP